MKRASMLLFLAALTFTAAPRTAVLSQTVQTGKAEEKLIPISKSAAAFAVSAPVSSFAPAQPEAGKTSRQIEGEDEENVREVKNKERVRTEADNAVHDADASPAQIAVDPMPAPLLTFEGLSSDDTFAAYGFRAIPPDTNGDVGANHYVQAVNLLARVFDKNGVPQTPPFKLSQIYAPLNTPCAMRDDGDPIVLYDALADRWLLSSFCTIAPPFRQMIAVSQTSDPTGGYFVYEFVMPNVKLNDYSKFGVWRDGYYMTTDQFLGSDFAGTGAFAFDRAKILAGDPTASFVYFDLSSPATIRLGGMLPADLDGITPPPADAPAIFASYTANEYGDASDALKLFDFRPNFANPLASTFTESAGSPIAVAAFDPTSPPDRTDVDQPAPGEKLDAQSDRLMYRVAYRNFGGSESLVLNQTVRSVPVGANYRAGVRFYELRRTTANQPFAVQNQATVGTAETNRWMASAAQDYQGNLAVGYSKSDLEKDPSIGYAGRLASDAPNTIRTEQILQDGTGVQDAFGSRWGDYSAMSVDPIDDCTFYYTNEYYTAESQQESPFGWLTRVGKFKFPTCTGAPRGTIGGTITNAATGEPISGAVLTTNVGYSRRTAANGNYNLTAAPNTSFNLTAAALGFSSQTVTVTIIDGVVMTRNFALQPVAVLQNQGIEITAESCRRNNAIEPGETVTINLPLRNTGAANAGNLVVTLLAVNGVTNPSAAQNYGALPINGNPVVRSFTFTASPNLACGAALDLTFQLNDGANDLGIIAQTFNAGANKVALRENFDRAPLGRLPVGWTTAASGGQTVWRAVRESSNTPLNAAYSSASFQIGLNEMISPAFAVTSNQAQLSFRNKYDLESTFLRNLLYDGAVLEIKIGANDWADILAAGGAFASGGYDGRLTSCCQNPLSGRLAWSGKSGTEQQTANFITTRVNLPAAAGQNVQLRWRVGTDIGTMRPGQWIDNVEVTDGFVCACSPITKSND